MTSKRVNPQLQQNGMDPMKPITHKTKATNILGTLPPHAVSQITVDVASMAENDESIPSMNKVEPRRNAQKFETDIASMAVGYVMKARPTPLVFVFVRSFYFSRYPTTVHTANPATKLNPQFEHEIITLSRMIGFFTSL